MNGLINLAYPVLTTLDELMSSIGASPVIRVAVWGAVTGAIAILVYWLLSDQTQIVEKKKRIRDIRQRLSALDGDELREVIDLSKRNLSAALSLLGSALLPSMLASLPVLIIMFWVSATFGYDFSTAGHTLKVDLVPVIGEPVLVSSDLDLKSVNADDFDMPGDALPGSIRVTGSNGNLIAALPSTPPAAMLHKRRWWNLLVGNESGYLPEDADLDEIRVSYPRLALLHSGPAWLRGWEFSFFVSLILMSLALKVSLRIE